jgi:predicted secreted protein
MKARMLLAAVALVMITGTVYGCAANADQAEDMTQPGGPAGIMPRNDNFVVTADDFAKRPFFTQETTVPVGLPVTVVLASNPTTGYKWGEKAIIGDESVARQTEHFTTGPNSSGSAPLVGAPGSETWRIDTLKAGTTTIKMEYSRPWEGGEKATWTYTLTLTVVPTSDLPKN